MNVRLFGFAVLIISWGLFASVDSDADIIYWDGIDRLSWADFEAEPRMDIVDFYALTSSGIIDYKGCKDGVITYKFRAAMRSVLRQALHKALLLAWTPPISRRATSGSSYYP